MSNADQLAELNQVLAQRFNDFRETCALLREFSTLHPGHGIPGDYYRESAATFAQASPELMVVRAGGRSDNIYDEIFLVQRPANDPEWPNQWHFPGTTHRYNDTRDDMMNRLYQGELGNAVKDRDPKLAHLYITTSGTRERGPCSHIILMQRVIPMFSIPGGTFFPVHKLPENTIGHHRAMIDACIAAGVLHSGW